MHLALGLSGRSSDVGADLGNAARSTRSRSLTVVQSGRPKAGQKHSAAEAFRLQEPLREKYDAAIQQTTGGYLSAAQDPRSSSEVVQSWHASR